MERSKQKRALDGARYAKKKEARKRMCEPLVEAEMKYLASDQIKGVDNTTPEEGSRDRSKKTVKEACETAASYSLKGSTGDLICSGAFWERDEQIKRNRIEKELENYLERKAQIERKSPNLINCAGRAEQNEVKEMIERKKARDRARNAKKKEAHKVEKEVKDMVSDLIKRVDNTLKEGGSCDGYGKTTKEGESSKIKVAVSSKFPEKREIERREKKKIRKEEQLFKQNKMLTEREMERRQRKRTCKEQIFKQSITLMESEIERKKSRKEEQLFKQSKTPMEKKIERREKKRVQARACYARKKKVTNMRLHETLMVVKDEIIDLVYDLVKRVEEDVKKVKEASRKATGFRMTESSRDLIRSKALRDEQANRIKKERMKELESYLERKAQIEKESQNSSVPRADEELEMEKKEKIRANYLRRKKAREEKQILENTSNKKVVAVIQQNRFKAQRIEDPETDPLKVEKPMEPSLQPVTFKMEVEVEPRQIEEPLLTYVKKEIDPLMPCIDEEHSQPMKIKTEPEEFQLTEESLFLYVKKEFMHLTPCIDEHFQPIKIKTEPVDFK